MVIYGNKRSMDSLGIIEMRIVFGKIASMVLFGNLTRGYIGKWKVWFHLIFF